MGISSSGISAPLGQLTPVTPLPSRGLTPEEILFLQALSPAFQAILYEVDGMKTAWGGTAAASGRQDLSQENAAQGYSRSVEVPGVLGSVARALAVNWNALSEEFSALKIKMLTTPLSLKQGGTGADGTAFTVLDLLRLNAGGTALESAGILSTDLSPLMRFFDGMIEETTDVAVFVDTGVIILSLEKAGGGDLNPYFAGTRVAYDTSPADTVALTAGTDIAPQSNFVFLTESGGTVTLNANTTGFPAGTPHVHIATVFCQSVASLDIDGAFKVHSWIDHLNDSTADGHSSHVNEKLRNLPATWISGVAPADLAANLHLATTTGVVFQLHNHTMPARTMPGDPVWVVNDPTTLYNRITALSGITQDADGTSITNRYFNIVLWGVVSEDEPDCKLFINLPSGVYTVESRAQLDDEQTSNFAIPSQFRGTAFLIARYTLKDTAGTLTQSQKVDLRGLLPSGSPGGGPGITSHLDLNDIGTKTHPTIDTHIDASSGVHGVTGDVVGTTDTQTLSAKTLTTPTIASMTNAQHDHSDAAGGGRLAARDRTITKIIYIEDPVAADSFPIAFLADAVSFVKVRGITDVGTVTFNIEFRGENTPDAVGTDILTSDLVADATGEETTTFDSSGDVVAERWLNCNVTSVATAPTKVWISLEYTID